MARTNLRRRQVVFLDRDGVINKQVHHLRRVRDLKILPRVTGALRKLSEAGYYVVIVTNQAVVAHGLITEKGIDYIHGVLIKRLAKSGAKVDGIYYCPHHPQGKITRYRIRCQCRKPNIGMIKKALKNLKVNPRGNFLIGDTTQDILTGKRAHLHTILVKTGYGGGDNEYRVSPDYVAKDLNEAACYIISKKK